MVQMPAIAQLRAEHASLIRLATEMSGLMAADNPQPAAISSLRWRLCRELLAHLTTEDKFLYPALMASSNPQAVRTAGQFSNEMGGLAAAFKLYIEDWTWDRIANDWSGFCAATQVILTALGNRIRRENEILYPLAEQTGQADKASAKKA